MLKASASIVVSPLKSAKTRRRPPRLVGPRSQYLGNPPERHPLRRSPTTPRRLRETSQQFEHPGVHLGSHGKPAHHSPCIFFLPICSSHLSVQYIFFGLNLYPQYSRTSVGEVRSGLVPGHFCRTRDLTVPSLTQFLGLGPGPPQTIYIGLVLVQTGSRRSLHILFIYLFKIEDGRLVWDGAVPRCSAYRGLGGSDTGEAIDGGRPG